MALEKPLLQSVTLAAASDVKDANGTRITAPAIVDTTFDPPRLIIELPDRALRDLGIATVDGSVSIVGNLLSTTPVTGQAVIAVTGTRIQLASNALNNGVIVFAKSTNSAAMTVGGSGVTNTVDGTGNGVILTAGSATSFAVSNTNALYVNGTNGDILSFSGS